MYKIVCIFIMLLLTTGCSSIKIGSSGEYQTLYKVNQEINKIKYVSDKRNYGVGDYYATPKEFYQNGGDCEDYSLAKYQRLKDSGYQIDQLWLVHGTVSDEYHNVLLVKAFDGNIYVLDNNQRTPLLANQVKYFKPNAMYNENSVQKFYSNDISGITKPAKFDEYSQKKIQDMFNRLNNEEI